MLHFSIQTAFFLFFFEMSHIKKWPLVTKRFKAYSLKQAKHNSVFSYGIIGILIHQKEKSPWTMSLTLLSLHLIYIQINFTGHYKFFSLFPFLLFSHICSIWIFSCLSFWIYYILIYPCLKNKIYISFIDYILEFL